ncbi:hypothetical protein J2Z83_001681 [Virgibacillus natechei]|uniref:Uncharacterized protein n=1 Tax=Virgibacillus natechei TaxID=1216297 RepID=A0ABS4IF46_9BACI|nr:hypothetical protein [Virgibacillus natechei]MBP1969574.1 hypothetical protein [Virgibacillus natechei]UZD14802.1 hypothetical protein OLD84_10020 [Virgibacillus natechei]
MSLAVRKFERTKRCDGAKKKDFEDSMQRITDQVRWIDQKLTMKVDKKISQGFQNNQQEISNTKSLIKKMSTLSKNDTV